MGDRWSWRWPSCSQCPQEGGNTDAPLESGFELISMLHAFSILVLKERQDHLNGVIPMSDGTYGNLLGSKYNPLAHPTAKCFRFSLDWTMEGLFWVFPLWARTAKCSSSTACHLSSDIRGHQLGVGLPPHIRVCLLSLWITVHSSPEKGCYSAML